MVEGAAKEILVKAVKDGNSPLSYAELVAFFMNHFPSTVDIDTIDQEFDSLRQNEGETVVAYWTRHQIVTQKADALGFAYEPVTSFRKRLIEGPVKAHVMNVIATNKLQGTPLELKDVVAVAMERDQRGDIKHFKRDARRETASAMVSTSHHQNRGRKRNHARVESQGAQGSRVALSTLGCFNCGQHGHKFGSMDNKLCPFPVSDKTKNYFAKKAKLAHQPVASGSGSVNPPAN